MNMEPWKHELYHHGIKGQHWGVRRGPPYPLGESIRSSVKKAKDTLTSNVDTQKVIHSLRNVAIASLGATAVIGAAYMAKKSGVFSKLHVSDLHAISEIKFDKNDNGERESHQSFFTPLSFQAAHNRYDDCLEKMDKIVYPDGKKSLRKIGMNPAEADSAVAKAIGVRMRQSFLLTDLSAFLQVVSEGKVKVEPDEIMTYQKYIEKIDANHKIFEDILNTGRDFGDLKNKEAREVLIIVRNLAEIYRDDRDFYDENTKRWYSSKKLGLS